jgi:signal peptidase I
LFGARASLADHYQVPTGSMEPTVVPGDHVCVDKRAYGLRAPLAEGYLTTWGGPARGDVVVLRSPETSDVLLKRVVAVPGDQVEVRDGRVSLGGVPVPVTPREPRAASALVESLGAPHTIRVEQGGGPDLEPVVVPPGRYLVLGDNRGSSHDGRSFGFVDGAAILGRAASVCVRGASPTWLPL